MYNLVKIEAYFEHIKLDAIIIMNDESYKRMCNGTEMYLGLHESVGISYGSNELAYIESYDAWYNSIEVYEIDEETKELYENHFPLICKYGWGIGTSLFFIGEEY